MGASGALRQLPLIAEQVLEEAVVPLHRVLGPSDLEPAGDRVVARAGAEAVLPAEALLLDGGALGFRTDKFRRVGSAMGLAERVAAGDQRDRLFVVHRHAREGLTDVARRGDRIRLAVRTLGVDVDQAHLHGGERILELPVAAVALVGQPLALRTPVDVVLRLPDVHASAGETGRLEAHRFQRAVPGEDHQVAPGELPAVFLLDRPQQQARLVEVRIVGPAIEGGEALGARAAAAAAVADAVGARAVPRHADEQRPIMAVVGWPPVLRRGHQREDVRFHGFQVEGLELLGVVEVLPHRIGQRRVLVEDRQIQPVRPPELVRHAPDNGLPADPAAHRAFAFGVHGHLQSWSALLFAGGR